MEAVHHQRKEWHDVESKIAADSAKAKSKIVLDIGGTRFVTSKQTLLAFDKSYFCAMLASDWQPDDDGVYFIDRDPKHFSSILNYMRTKDTHLLTGLNKSDIMELQKELDYYQIEVEAVDSLVHGHEEKEAWCSKLTKADVGCKSKGDVEVEVDVKTVKAKGTIDGKAKGGTPKFGGFGKKH